ncbi:MAG TPA: preprotein translocase subunit YajC [Clostridia bacterium]|nr:preprotein translocase subunit YajC [Clostridia bacterium]
MFNLHFLPLAASASTANTSTIGSLAVTFLPLLLIFVVFYFLLIRPQRKKEKDTQKMRSNVQVGDEVITIGGIMGRVVSIKDDTLVIETAADRNKVRIKKWAIQTNTTVHDEIA